MNKIWLVFQREYLSRVKNKAFWLITLLAPIGIILLAFLPVMINLFTNDKQVIAVVDESSLFSNVFVDGSNTKFKMESTALEDLKKNYTTKGYTSILVIPKINLNEQPNLLYYSKNPLGLQLKTQILTQINQKIVELKLEQAKLDPSFAKNLQQNANIESKILDKEGEKSGSSTIGTIIGYASGLIIYIVLLVYGSMVMQGVLEEKNSRIVEILISSIKPFELMIGKILGIAFVGLTQFAVWIALTIFGFLIAGLLLSPLLLQNLKTSPSATTQISNLSTSNAISSNTEAIDLETLTLISEVQNLNFNLIFTSFIIYFLGGYLLYASLFAAIGSAVNNEKEASGLILPVMMPIIISFMFLFSVTQNPNGDLAFWLSMIPFSSPIIMLSRIPFGVPWWQITISILILFSSFVVFTYLAAKIYRVGILSYGSKPKLKDLWKWMTN